MTRLQDDFYTGVNEAWLATAVIPADRPVTGGFVEIAEAVEDEERARLAEWASGEAEAPSELTEFVKFYGLTSNWEARNTAGILPLIPLLARYQNLASWQDWVAAVPELIRSGLPSGLPLEVAPDMKNALVNELWLHAPGLILPDVTYYQADHAQAPRLLAVWTEMVDELLTVAEFSQRDRERILGHAKAFDAVLACFVLSSEARSEYWRLYNPTPLADLAVPFDLAGVLRDLFGDKLTQVIVSEERFWQNAGEIFAEANWPLFKDWLLVRVLTRYTGYLSNDLRILGGKFGRALSGSAEAPDTDKAAFRLAHAAFAPGIGQWYGVTYFGETAKADVAHMVREMIRIYDERLAKNDWLSAPTIAKARLKLKKISVQVGYPDAVPERYLARKVDANAGLLSNVLAFNAAEVQHELAQWHQAVDRSEWHMPADMVNAYYSPDANQIVFPAAILQAPFYSLTQSKSANFGGIGAVIAHEISHAFDTNGARFDENGNLNAWWTDADFAAFETRTKAVVAQFDGQEIAGARVNGELTKSENVADLAGVAAALNAAKLDDDYDVQTFFTQFATIWRKKATAEYAKLLAAVDVHGPAELRTNVTVTNFDEFFAAFDVTENDDMWRAENQRVQIW